MSTAQAVFSVALGVVTLSVAAFAVYVLSSAAWGDRWVAHRDARAPEEPGERR